MQALLVSSLVAQVLLVSSPVARALLINSLVAQALLVVQALLAAVIYEYFVYLIVYCHIRFANTNLVE